MAFRARKGFGTFEKRAPGPIIEDMMIFFPDCSSCNIKNRQCLFSLFFLIQSECRSSTKKKHGRSRLYNMFETTPGANQPRVE